MDATAQRSAFCAVCASMCDCMLGSREFQSHQHERDSGEAFYGKHRFSEVSVVLEICTYITHWETKLKLG